MSNKEMSLVSFLYGIAIMLFLSGIKPEWFCVHKTHTCPQPEPEIIYVQEKDIPLTDSTYMRVETRSTIIRK